MSAPGAGAADAADDAALRRLRMRAWRRGTREMDLILGPFADEGLERLSDADRARFEALLEENDHDLYRWIAGRIAGPGGAAAPAVTRAEGADSVGPADLQPLLERIAAHAAQRLR